MTRAQQGVVLFLSLLLSLVFLLTHSSFFLPKGSAPFQEISFPEKSPQGMITIEVDGSVHQRGTYTVQSGVTVLEAVEKAGGVTEKLSFPPEDLHRPLQQNGRLNVFASGDGKGRVEIQSLAPAKLRVLGIPLNINTATVDELDILPGIGPKTAQAIVEYRESYGRFAAPEDLLNIPGIGKKKIEALRKQISIN